MHLATDWTLEGEGLNFNANLFAPLLRGIARVFVPRWQARNFLFFPTGGVKIVMIGRKFTKKEIINFNAPSACKKIYLSAKFNILRLR